MSYDPPLAGPSTSCSMASSNTLYFRPQPIKTGQTTPLDESKIKWLAAQRHDVSEHALQLSGALASSAKHQPLRQDSVGNGIRAEVFKISSQSKAIALVSPKFELPDTSSQKWRDACIANSLALSGGALPSISTGSSQAPWHSRRRGPLRDGPCSLQTAQLLDDRKLFRASLRRACMDLSWQAQLSLQSFLVASI